MTDTYHKRKKVRVTITAQLLGGVIGDAAKDQHLADDDSDSVAGEWTVTLIERCPECSGEPAIIKEKETLHALIDKSGEAVKKSSDASLL